MRFFLVFFTLIITFSASSSLGANQEFESFDKLLDTIIEAKPATQNVVTTPYNSGFISSFADEAAKKPIIVIDAGHGGKDPGAIGHRRVKEKNITLKYAKILKATLDKTGRYKTYLTRSRDRFLPLRERNKVARNRKADLFISIHADSALNKKARGFSVYSLSNKASTKEAAQLAAKENMTDIIIGINLNGIDKEASNMLIDLSLNRAMSHSARFAKILASKMKKKKIKTRSTITHSAGFVVLKNPNMVSVLLELGFLTNKHDAKNLRKYNYQQSIISGIVSSINSYFKK